MNEIQIRPLVEEDLNTYWLIRLEALKNNPEAFAATLEETLTGEDPKQNVKQYITGEGMTTYGAFVDGRLAAVATVRRYPLEKMNHKGSLLGMYVSKAIRGVGIGRRLIEFIIKDSEEKNIEQLQLMVVTTNYRAKQLYSSLGFQTYGIEKKAFKYEGLYWDEELMALYIK